MGGGASLPNGNLHAFLWTPHAGMQDLGTLGGPNSAASGPNDHDKVPIISDTPTMDPLGEDFCGFGTHLICVGAIWHNGVMTPLATLGGNNAQTTTANTVGQIVGFSENATYGLELRIDDHTFSSSRLRSRDVGPKRQNPRAPAVAR